MKKFNHQFTPGTQVLLEQGGWATVKVVSDSRLHVTLKEFEGSFQRGHIVKFSNSKPPRNNFSKFQLNFSYQK